MKLLYPSIDKRPVIYVAVQSGGHAFMIQMLLDTGADNTTFPAGCAAYLGHDNQAKGVRKRTSQGIGGKSKGYLHTQLEVSLLDPSTSVTRRMKSAPGFVWTSSIHEFCFVNGLEGFGLLGRDLMSEWQRVCFIPQTKQWLIELEV